jgi:hypothetical protein
MVHADGAPGASGALGSPSHDTLSDALEVLAELAIGTPEDAALE